MVSPPPPPPRRRRGRRPALIVRLRPFFSLRPALRVCGLRGEDEEGEEEDGLEFPKDAKFEHAAAAAAGAVALGAVGGPGTPRLSHGAPGGRVEGSAPEPPAAGMNMISGAFPLRNSGNKRWKDNSADQINVSKGCVSAVLIHATFDHVIWTAE